VGRLSRQVALGEGLDFDGLQATLRNGVSRLSIPVSDRVKPRRVQVSGGYDESLPIESKSPNES